MLVACSTGDEEVTRYKLNWDSTLLFASFKVIASVLRSVGGHEHLIPLLLQAKADIESKLTIAGNMTPLMTAASKNYAKIVRILIDKS